MESVHFCGVSVMAQLPTCYKRIQQIDTPGLDTGHSEGWCWADHSCWPILSDPARIPSSIYSEFTKCRVWRSGFSCPITGAALKSNRPYFDDIFQDENSDQGEAQPVHESPADAQEAEPLAEDRIIPFEEDSSVMIEDVAYTVDSSLRVLRAGCIALGLSTRGSKKDYFKRMVEHLKTQSLIVAQGVEAQT